MARGRRAPASAGAREAAPRPATWSTCGAAIALFLAVALGSLWWARAIPENGAPDEYEHIATQRFVAENGRLPAFGEGRFRIHLMDSVCRTPIYPIIEGGRMAFQSGTELHGGHRHELRQPYLFSPQLAHLLGGLLARMTGGFALWKARAVSAVWIAAASVAVFLAARRLWPDRLATALLSGLVFGLWPQVTFLGAYVNDDALALLTTTLLLLACTHIERAGATWRSGAALGAAIGLVALSKVYALATLPLAGLWMARHCARRGKGAARRFLLSGMIALLVAAAWFAFDHLTHDEQARAGSARTEAVRDFIAALPPALARQTDLLEAGSLHGTGRSILDFPFRPWFLVTLFSYYGAFGWMDEPLPLSLYIVSALSFCAALAGLLPGDRNLRPPALRVPFLFSFPLLSLIALFSIAHAYYVDFQPQGRYLLPSAPGISIMAAAGASSFPGRLGRLAPFLLATLVVAVSLYARLFVLR